MHGKSAEGFPADSRESLAANEDFAGTVDDLETVSAARTGWDPYDVWRTRVKTASKDHEGDLRR
jgi:hypothetical protein